MIGEITKNVKEKMMNIARNLHDYLTKPQQKYILEMISGCFATCSLNLSAISGYLYVTILKILRQMKYRQMKYKKGSLRYLKLLIKVCSVSKFANIL